jgi:hypothetical protein
MDDLISLFDNLKINYDLDDSDIKELENAIEKLDITKESNIKTIFDYINILINKKRCGSNIHHNAIKWQEAF